MEFQSVDLCLKAMIDGFTASSNLKSVSNYAFSSLYLWNNGDVISAAAEDDVLFVLQRFSGNPAAMLMPIPYGRSDEESRFRAVKTAERWFLEHDIKPAFAALDTESANLFAKRLPEYTLTEDRDNEDYVYDARSLITLSGKKLHAKRNHINKFNSLYESEYVRITPDAVNECLALFDLWQKNSAGYDRYGEREALKKAIVNMDALGLVAGGIAVDGKLAALSVGERLTDDTALIHFEKADSSYAGIYSVINQRFAENEFSDVRLINREEDMGIEGLRKSKLSYNPTMLIQKYTAKL